MAGAMGSNGSPLPELPCSASKAGSSKSRKREDYLEWPEYFMAIAFLSAMRSKDPASQVGACIVNSDNKIVGIGYNGMPIGCSDDILPWGKESPNKLDNKYMYDDSNWISARLDNAVTIKTRQNERPPSRRFGPTRIVIRACWEHNENLPRALVQSFVCHAEMNAILNKNCSEVRGCTIYVALFPCNECAKIIIQSHIKEVIYFSDKHAHKVETVAAKRMFDCAGIKYRQFTPKHGKILIDFEAINRSSIAVQDLTEAFEKAAV